MGWVVVVLLPSAAAHTTGDTHPTCTPQMLSFALCTVQSYSDPPSLGTHLPPPRRPLPPPLPCRQAAGR